MYVMRDARLRISLADEMLGSAVKLQSTFVHFAEGSATYFVCKLKFVRIAAILCSREL